MVLNVDPKEYIERMRVPYFHRVKNLAQGLCCEPEDKRIKIFSYQIAMGAGEQFLILGSMKGKMPDLESEIMLTDLLMPLKKAWDLGSNGTREEIWPLIDQIYLAYSELRKYINPKSQLEV